MSICRQVPDVQQFLVHYNMQCPMAQRRLIQSGMPATMEHGKPRYRNNCTSNLQVPAIPPLTSVMPWWIQLQMLQATFIADAVQGVTGVTLCCQYC